MKASDISLDNLAFLEVAVLVNTEFEGSITDFNFDGIVFDWGIRHGQRNDEGTKWWVGLEIAINNDEKTDKASPYTINLRAAGMFSINPNYPADRREKFVYESGASLIYGAIREMVCNITARSAHGSFLLPTSSFFGSYDDHLKSKPNEEAQ
jgi:preprotein translocase subunit SecB